MLKLTTKSVSVAVFSALLLVAACGKKNAQKSPAAKPQVAQKKAPAKLKPEVAPAPRPVDAQNALPGLYTSQCSPASFSIETEDGQQYSFQSYLVVLDISATEMTENIVAFTTANCDWLSGQQLVSADEQGNEVPDYKWSYTTDQKGSADGASPYKISYTGENDDSLSGSDSNVIVKNNTVTFSDSSEAGFVYTRVQQ